MAELAFLAAVGIASMVTAWFLRPGVALCVSVVAGVLQIFLFTDLSVSLGAVWQLAAWVTVLRHWNGLRLPRVLALAYAALVVLSALVLLWSPDRSAGFTLTAQLIALGSTVSLGVITVSRAPHAFAVATWLFAAFAALSALTVLAFRFDPTLEHGYFVSRLFGILNSNDIAAHFFTTERNNVLDKAKSGGLYFVNANAASLFCGAGAAFLGGRAVAAKGARRALLAVVSVLSFAAAIGTGSKTALYLGAAACIVLGVVMVLIARRAARQRAVALLGLSSFVVGIAMVALPLLIVALPTPVQEARPLAPPTETVAPAVSAPPAVSPTPPIVGREGLANQSADSIGTRVEIWKVAAIVFRHDPIGTLGYGGWHAVYAPLAAPRGLNPAYPPHNWVIESWSEVGPLGLLLIGAILVTVATLVVKAFRASEAGEGIGVILLAIGLGWIVVHGLADNTGFYGGPRLIPIVGLTIGALTAAAPGRTRETARRRRRVQRDAGGRSSRSAAAATAR